MPVVTSPSSDNSNAGVRPGWFVFGAMIVLLLATPILPTYLIDVPTALLLPLAAWIGDCLNWLARDAAIGSVTFQSVTRAMAGIVEAPIKGLNALLSNGYSTGAGFNKKEILPPLSWFGVTTVVSWFAWRISGRDLALTVLTAGAYLVTFGLWSSAMTTLANVILCVIMALALGLFLGIRSYRSRRTEAIIRGVMNVMQTVPIFSYLIPTLLLFGYGPSAALFATVVYALPPMVHATVLALRSVPEETLELARITGCSRLQTLWRVELPVAVPKLAIGLNQVVMMSLNMVIIASMIGAGGLGYNVLRALRRLDIGAGLQAGLGIVALAVILDRITQTVATEKSTGGRKLVGRKHLLIIFILLAIPTVLSLIVPALAHWPKGWMLTTAPFWNEAVSWINREFFDVLETGRTTMLLYVMYPLRDALLALPYVLIIAGVGAIGWWLSGARLMALTIGFLTFVAVSGYWDAAMVSVYLITISVVIALGLGMPLGFWFSSRPRWHEPATIALDTLQTLPTLVYLLPAVMLFRNGDFSALIAVTSYAIAPAVRYGMQGMRHVPADRLEAAAIAGATPWQTFKWVKLPAAMPTLILGVNQTVMMALSMLIIAALVGTRDLGQEVFTSLSRGNSGEGIIAGLCVQPSP